MLTYQVRMLDEAPRTPQRPAKPLPTEEMVELMLQLEGYELFGAWRSSRVLVIDYKTWPLPKPTELHLVGGVWVRVGTDNAQGERYRRMS